MCDFVSWIEKDGTLWYLTTADIQSKRGKELMDYTQNRDDLKGHGAIRWFYDLKGGIEKECIGFSSPGNFPAEIAEAIKQGKFSRWFGAVPKGILRAPLYADYKAKRAPLYDDYEAKRAPLYADYEAKRDALHADYEAKRDALDCQAWLLAIDPENRADAWK